MAFYFRVLIGVLLCFSQSRLSCLRLAKLSATSDGVRSGEQIGAGVLADTAAEEASVVIFLAEG